MIQSILLIQLSVFHAVVYICQEMKDWAIVILQMRYKFIPYFPLSMVSLVSLRPFCVIHYGIIWWRINYYFGWHFRFSFQSRIVLFKTRLVWKVLLNLFSFITETVDIVSQQLAVCKTMIMNEKLRCFGSASIMNLNIIHFYLS